MWLNEYNHALYCSIVFWIFLGPKSFSNKFIYVCISVKCQLLFDFSIYSEITKTQTANNTDWLLVIIPYTDSILISRLKWAIFRFNMFTQYTKVCSHFCCCCCWYFWIFSSAYPIEWTWHKQTLPIIPFYCYYSIKFDGKSFKHVFFLSILLRNLAKFKWMHENNRWTFDSSVAECRMQKYTGVDRWNRIIDI